jgi:outer membrane protein assembly factor BamB
VGGAPTVASDPLPGARLGRFGLGARPRPAGTLLAATTSGTSINWPAYLNGPTHSSYQAAATAITPTNAASLTPAWTWVPGAPPKPDLTGLISSPTVFDGVVYIGANNGTFYALNESTGSVLWSDFIGYVTKTTCGDRGFASTATVAVDPATGAPAVYVATPTGYLYAFDAATGAVLWHSVIGIPSTTQNDYFDWSSPTVVNGTIYVGIASQCDMPLVRAGVASYSAGTGAHLTTFYTVPKGDVGASIWSSAAVDPNGNVYVTTGNGPTGSQLLGNSESILKLGGGLKLLSSYQINDPNKEDSDFGGSPTLFTATLPGQTKPTPMVGACNKNGYYYAWNRAAIAAGPVWTVYLGNHAPPVGNDICVAAAAWDGHHLYLVGPTTTVGGTTYPGSVSEVNPATGAIIWQEGVAGETDGSPTLDGGGVIAVPVYSPKAGTTAGSYLYNASTGALLTQLSPNGGADFAQPVFAGGDLFLAQSSGLTAFDVPAH